MELCNRNPLYCALRARGFTPSVSQVVARGMNAMVPFGTVRDMGPLAVARWLDCATHWARQMMRPAA